MLNDNLGVYDARRAIGEINKLTEKDDKDCADSVLQVVLVKNRESFDIVRREEGEMCEALRELMKDEIEEELRKARTKGLEEGRDTGIKFIVFNALELGKTADEIVHFTGLSEEEVEGFVKEWKNK